ncbi:signal peptide, CUB and EGF-like domain-containing protein 2, partial [Elysia marginata]
MCTPCRSLFPPRPCNCDLLDDEFRRDAGIIDKKMALPITMFNLGAITNMSQASLTVGDLYCAQEPLNINECTEGTDDCGENAFCENLIGSYRCICNKGFRGDGKECIPVGQCSCFGDPHCNSFDDRWLHYMGDCQYVMATDGCEGKSPSFT